MLSHHFHDICINRAGNLMHHPGDPGTAEALETVQKRQFKMSAEGFEKGMLNHGSNNYNPKSLNNPDRSRENSYLPLFKNYMHEDR